MRALLETHGASTAELTAHSDEIARVRSELASDLGGGSMSKLLRLNYDRAQSARS